MVRTYRAIDLCNLYSCLEGERGFLLLSSEKNGSDERKIKIDEEHILEANYQEEEEVCAVFINTETGKCEEKVLSCTEGVYELHNMLDERKIFTKPLEDDMWECRRRWYYIDEETLVISDNAIIIDGTANHDKKEIILRNKDKSELPLTYIGLFGDSEMLGTELYNKYLLEKDLLLADFFSLIDDLPYWGYLCLGFGSLYIEFCEEEIKLKKIYRRRKKRNWSLDNYVDEGFELCLDREKITFPSMFVTFVAREESEKRLLKGLEEYYLNCN